MTTNYQAIDRNCIECGTTVETYTGHLQASEMTACEDCYEHLKENASYGVDIVHCVPPKDPITEMKKIPHWEELLDELWVFAGREKYNRFDVEKFADEQNYDREMVRLVLNVESAAVVLTKRKYNGTVSFCEKWGDTVWEKRLS